MQENSTMFPDPSPGEGSGLPRHHIPTPLTLLIGREQDAAAACALLQRPEVRLVTLRGVGGVGKTRLALQVATDLQEGFVYEVCFISLAPLRNPDLVLPTIAHALGLTETGDWPLLERLYAFLHEKHMVLVLDNFEQVATAASHLSELLVACPGIKLLVTSRIALHIDGEHEYTVHPLAVPDLQHLPQLPEPEVLLQSAAVVLFLQRARAIKPAFQLTPANAGVIAEICVRLDGLPLAIELAAARINLLSLRSLLGRLSHRLAVLTSTSQDASARQQTLRNTLTWSYDLLNVEMQQLFGHLSVFVGGCTLEAVETVCGTGDDLGALSRFSILDGVASLVDASFLNTMEQEDQEVRLTMLETIHEYGWECLLSSGEARVIQRAHAVYYLRLAEEAELQLTGPEQGAWLKRLEWEQENLRAALQWWMDQGESEMALRMGGALAQFWWIRGYMSEGRHWLERVLSISRGGKSALRAKALVGAGALATLQDDFAQAELLCEEGLALYRELGDRRGSATALSSLGYAAMMRSNYASARVLEEEALALSREVGDTGGSASALNIIASVLYYEGEYAQAQLLLEESLLLSREVGAVQSQALALVLLGLVLQYQGDLIQAQARLQESLAVSRKVSYKRNIGLSIYFLGTVTLRQGDMNRARSLLEESLVFFEEVGERGRIANVLASKGILSFSLGDYAAARELLEESLKIIVELDYQWDIAVCLEGLAAVAAAQEEPVRAVWFMSAAQALRESIGTPLPSSLQALHEFTITTMRTQLGEHAFDTAWVEGRTMTPEHVLLSLEPLPASKPVLTTQSLAAVAPLSHAGLTLREMDVLRLLAQGLTSAQISERLVIGLVTVNSHVRSIYSKLGVTSRAAATRYALDHHLL